MATAHFYSYISKLSPSWFMTDEWRTLKLETCTVDLWTGVLLHEAHYVQCMLWSLWRVELRLLLNCIVLNRCFYYFVHRNIWLKLRPPKWSSDTVFRVQQFYSPETRWQQQRENLLPKCSDSLNISVFRNKATCWEAVKWLFRGKIVW